MFARDAEPFAEKFKAHSLGKTFPENFKQLIQRYELAVSGRESDKGQSAAARASIEAAIISGRTAARRLDIIIANELGVDPVAVAEWQRNRRVGYRVTKPPPDAVTAPTGLPKVPSLEPVSSTSGSEEEAQMTSDAPTTPSTTASVVPDVSDMPDVGMSDAVDEQAA